jgi:hypothetical protein
LLLSAEGPRKPNEWPVYGGDAGGLKYSPLTSIDRSNVSKLAVAWTWKTGEQPIAASGTTLAARPGQFQVTPLAIGDTLYLSTPFNRVVALDASTGRQLWSYDPRAYEAGQPSNGTGLVHRGVATWSDGKERRILMASRWRLIALDAATGRPISSFGANGEVDLTADILWSVEKKHYTNTSPPVVYGDLVIVGNGVGDRLVYKRDPPGRHPGLRRAHRPPSVAVQSDSAAGGVRPRDVGGQLVGAHGPHERLGAVHGRRRAWARLPAVRDAKQRLVRRRAPWGQSVRRNARLSRRANGAAGMALPDHEAWALGLRPSLAADSRDDPEGRTCR